MTTHGHEDRTLTTEKEELFEFFPYGWPLGLDRDKRVACVPPAHIVPGKTYRIVNLDLETLTASLEDA